MTPALQAGSYESTTDEAYFATLFTEGGLYDFMGNHIKGRKHIETFRRKIFETIPHRDHRFILFHHLVVIIRNASVFEQSVEPIELRRFVGESLNAGIALILMMVVCSQLSFRLPLLWRSSCTFGAFEDTDIAERSWPLSIILALRPE